MLEVRDQKLRPSEILTTVARGCLRQADRLESREKIKEVHGSSNDEDVNGDTRAIVSVEEKSFDMLHARKR